MELGRHRDGHRVDPAQHVAVVEDRARPARRRDLVGAHAIGVDHRLELHAGQRRQNPRVVFAEVSNADNGDAQAHQCQPFIRVNLVARRCRCPPRRRR